MSRSLSSGWKLAFATVAVTTLFVGAWFMRVEPDTKAYFPDNTFEADKAGWFSAGLSAMQEPSLFALDHEDGAMYRITIFRSLMRPISIHRPLRTPSFNFPTKECRVERRAKKKQLQWVPIRMQQSNQSQPKRA